MAQTYLNIYSDFMKGYNNGNRAVYVDFCEYHIENGITINAACDAIEILLKSNHNPYSKFYHHTARNHTYLVFKSNVRLVNQDVIVDILTELKNRDNLPKYIIIESDGSHNLIQNFINFFNGLTSDWSDGVKKKVDLCWSITMTENTNITHIKSYANVSNNGVVNVTCEGMLKCFEKIHWMNEALHSNNVEWSIWIKSKNNDIKQECWNRGYNIIEG
jgi:hypothetical protein